LILEADLPGEDLDQELVRSQLENRMRMMDALASRVARKLDLSDVRFLARSKRPQGAYTFSAVDEENKNVVLKIQPVSELAGYAKMQQLASKLPSEIYRHVPFIKTIRTLDSLRIESPEPLGVIVMEGLEQLPGNLFNLITEPPQRSAASLSALLGYPDALRSVAKRSLDSTEKVLSKVISDQGLVRQYLDDFIDRMVSLSERSKELVDPDGDATEQFYNLREIIEGIAADWFNSLHAIPEAEVRRLRSNVLSSIRNDFTSALTNRAIPINPGKKSPGALSALPGINNLQRAIEYLRSLGVQLEDVHGNNIMVRPETGELVLSDLGHFG
jgi:hypothetical protein